MYETMDITPNAVAVAIETLLEERDWYRDEFLRLQNTPRDGSAAPGSNARKLRPDEVITIRYLYRAGETQAAIAGIYDLNRATVSRIVRGEYHK